jgi:hypothetical protein
VARFTIEQIRELVSRVGMIVPPTQAVASIRAPRHHVEVGL